MILSDAYDIGYTKHNEVGLAYAPNIGADGFLVRILVACCRLHVSMFTEISPPIINGNASPSSY